MKTLVLVFFSLLQTSSDVTGKWSFQVQTSVGSGTPTISLKQDGEKLTGHYSGQLGEADLTGTVKGQSITFTFTVNVQGYEIVATYTGTIEDKDSLKGTTHLGDLGDGTFTAKRAASPPGTGGVAAP
jgi:hypothetical protein